MCARPRGQIKSPIRQAPYGTEKLRGTTHIAAPKNAAAQSSLTRKTCAANGQKAFTRLLRSDRRGCLPPARTHRRLSWGKRAAALSITAFLAFDFIRFARDCQAEQGRLSVKGSLPRGVEHGCEVRFRRKGNFPPVSRLCARLLGSLSTQKARGGFCRPGPSRSHGYRFFQITNSPSRKISTSRPSASRAVQRISRLPNMKSTCSIEVFRPRATSASLLRSPPGITST